MLQSRLRTTALIPQAGTICRVRLNVLTCYGVCYTRSVSMYSPQSWWLPQIGDFS